MTNKRILAALIICHLLLWWVVTTGKAQTPAATANSYLDRGNALADYSRALALAPHFAEAWFNRGTLWNARGDLERAEADFTRAIELKPDLADAYAQRGLVRLLQGRDNDARQDFDRCLALDVRLKQSLERHIEEAKRHLSRRTQNPWAQWENSRAVLRRYTSPMPPAPGFCID